MKIFGWSCIGIQKDDSEHDKLIEGWGLQIVRHNWPIGITMVFQATKSISADWLDEYNELQQHDFKIIPVKGKNNI